MSIAFLSRIGTAKESDLPYTQAANVESLTSGKYPEDYEHPLRLRAAYELGAITDSNMENVKHLIMDYGGVRIGYKHSDNGLNLNTNSYYMPDNKGNGHAVILVGWDNDYPASNFGTSPQRNGAWLAKNSWGTDFGDGGYFWISYAQYIYTCAVYIASESTSNGSVLYGHDTIAAVDTIPYHWSANIFKAEGTETLTETAFYTKDNNTQYEVYVNKFGTTEPENGPGTPQNGPVASGKLPYSGYHTVELNSPVEIENGEYFAVMVKLVSPSGSKHITTAENNPNSGGGTISASGITAAGMSYFAEAETTPASADWTDGKRLSGGSYNACIKIFASESGPVKISMLRLPSGTVGQTYSYTLVASGARPITWTVTGLPDGLDYDSGKITGTPSKAGTYSVNVSATNSKGSDSATLELVINTSDSPTPDDPVNPTPDDPVNPTPDNPGSNTSGSSGGGGCNSGLFAGILSTLFLIASTKKR